MRKSKQRYFMKNLFILGTLFALSACTPIVKKGSTQTLQTLQTPQATQIPQTSNSNYRLIDKKHNDLLNKGKKLVENGDKKNAIIHYFNPVIKEYETTYANSSKRIYTARTQAEHDFYLMTASNEGKTAHVLSETWSRAYYLKAYTLLELKELQLAEKNIRKALYLSPSNSKYLSELGRIQHLNKAWRKALKSYQLAEKSANFFSPQSVKKQELLRAKRGIGYSYTELKELKKAEAVYNEILKIDSRDTVALKELKYIRGLQKK
jgi:tetratricopeptide (TPR) repeat protein